MPAEGVHHVTKALEVDNHKVVNVDASDMVNALGGVQECNTTPIDDPKSGLNLTIGHHMLNGVQALGYVRARYTLGNGSDLERIGRQQAFMSSLVSRVKSQLLNPLAIYNFLNAATRSVTIDTGLGGIHGLYNLASSLKNMQRSQVTFFTVPTYPRALVDPTDNANVMWTQPEASLIFQAFQDDMPVSKALFALPKAPALAPDTVSVDVLNGTQQAGLEATVAAVLQQDGFKASPQPQPPSRTSPKPSSSTLQRWRPPPSCSRPRSPVRACSRSRAARRRSRSSSAAITAPPPTSRRRRHRHQPRSPRPASRPGPPTRTSAPRRRTGGLG